MHKSRIGKLRLEMQSFSQTIIYILVFESVLIFRHLKLEIALAILA